MNENIEIFCCYVQKDQPLLLTLRTHLASLEREGILNIWHDISPGMNREEEINKHFNTAHLILLLISPDFMASEYCYSQEMRQAIERHERGEACVIPVFLRPSIWQEALFGKLQALPNNTRAATEWRNRDQAFVAIAQGIEQAAKEWLTKVSMTSSHQSLSTINVTRLHLKSIAGDTRRDWGEAPDVPVFFGRTKELILLEQWIMEDRCRLVALVGMKGIGKTKLSVKLGRGGIGKTDLSLKLARGIEERFDYVIWRRLLNAPKVSEILTDLIKFLSNQQEVHMPDTVSGQISRLLHYLQQSRTLLILDNVEMILQSGKHAGQYSSGYEEYGQLFEKIAEVPHQSCLLLTSREKTPEIARLESKAGPVRSLEVRGLHYSESKKIFAEIGSFSGSKEDWKQMNYLYNGNPLALELAARHIKEVFFGSISEFLREGKPIFADLRGLLDWHFNRLSDSHKEVMYWFAINREPTSLSELKEDILSSVGKEQISSTLHSLQRLIPLEKSANSFTLQPVLIEYMTERFVEQIVEEIRTGEMNLFNTHALLKTSVLDYVRETQSRLILKSMSEKLLGIYGNRIRLEVRLKKLLSLLREHFHFTSGYAGGNLLNLLCYLKVDLRGYDFSSLAVWHAYLQGMSVQEAKFSQAHFFRSVFTDAFGTILSISLSPNEGLLVAGTANGELRLWNVGTGTPLQVYHGHTGWVWSVAFSPQSNVIASGSEDETVRLWDTQSGRCIHLLQGHTNRIRSVAFSSDGKLLASGCEDRTIRIWDVETGQCKFVLPGFSHWIRAVTFSPDGKLLANGGDSSAIWLWDVATGTHIRTLDEHTNRIWSLAFSSNGILASGGDDYTVKLWDCNAGRCLNTLEGHTHRIWSLAFGSNGQKLASGSHDQTIRLWDVQTDQCLNTLRGHTNHIWSLDFSINGKMLASASDDRTIRLWDVQTGQCLNILRGYVDWIWSITLAQDGTILASCDESLAIRLWDVQTHQLFRSLYGHTSRIRSVAMNPDATTVVSCSEDQTVRVWDIKTGQCLKILQECKCDSNNSELHAANRVWAVALSQNGQMIASGNEDHTVRIWDTTTYQCLQVLQGNDGWVWSVAFHPHNHILVCGGESTSIRVWNVSSGECLAILSGHTSRIWTVTFSLDGMLIASGGDDQTIRIWDVATYKCRSILHGHTNHIRSIAFGPDGTLLASGSEDETIRVWNWQTGQCLHILKGHTNRVMSVAFSKDGKTLLSGSHDGTVKLWSISTGYCLQTLRSDRPYERMNISGTTGLSETQRASLKLLGAIDSDSIA